MGTIENQPKREEVHSVNPEECKCIYYNYQQIMKEACVIEVTIKGNRTAISGIVMFSKLTLKRFYSLI